MKKIALLLTLFVNLFAHSDTNTTTGIYQSFQHLFSSADHILTIVCVVMLAYFIKKYSFKS